MKKITLPAYAKINLFLDISSVKENGYHNIVSFMQSISLCDIVSVSLTEEEEKSIEVVCNDPCVPCNSDNLVYKIAEAFPLNGRIKIEIEKNIPMSAGLAGGSTDAAATLLALNMLSDNKLSREEMVKFAARFGADIPFCLLGGACMATGIGDILNEIDDMPDYPMVIAKMGDGMSTPSAYKALDAKFNKFVDYQWNRDSLDIIRNFDVNDGVDKFCRGLYNIFESVVESERPYVTMLKNTMIQFGASGAMMSGSGTSVFGIFPDIESARAACNELIAKGAQAHVCHKQKKSPHF